MERLEQGDPRVVGRYRIQARVALGGMAVVYLGRSPGGRLVAVKVPHAESVREPEFRARFRLEVEAATAVRGAYSPPVLAADPDARAPWMTTEFVASVPLRDAVEEYGPLPAPSVRRLAAGLVEALAAVHRAGFVHLDVTPANVLLGADGPLLVDFGIAARTRSTGPAGSRGFMSPEQMAGDAGPPSDVYSLGATLAYARGPRQTDERLSALIAECGQPDAADRPTLAQLACRLAELTPQTERSDSAWLPPLVLAAIDRQAREAADPPPPAPAPPDRRALLVGGVTALTVAAATGITVLLTGAGETSPSGQQGPRASRRTVSAPPSSPSSPSSPSVPSVPSVSSSPSAKPVTVEFVITGDGPLSELIYWVNGRPTTLGNVALSWRRTVQVPSTSASIDWRLRYTFPSGRTRVRVFQDGSRTADQTFPPKTMLDFPGLYPCDVDTGGSVAGPLPSTGV
ncbi:serine/threonine-protein kinase [Streptomyces prunicolor]|uniref:serine/threonine-protein kinase n=1 Tax=Streptomyces prunicolor TaxID=67348 RepID=UPI003713C90C